MNASLAVTGVEYPSVDPRAAVRAFFALVPAPEVRLAFGELARQVARRARGRAVSSDHLHVTLAFLGDVPLTALPALEEVGAGLPHDGGVLVFDALGAWRASGVAWVAPTVVPATITHLHAALGAALGAAGFNVESRAFRPHVTLARRCVQVQPRARAEPLIWQVDRLCLMGSELRPEGPVYRSIAEWPLAVLR